LHRWAYSIAVERPDEHREGEVRKNIMAVVYILQSQKNGRYYIGSTNNIERRLLEHNSGKTKSLRNILPVELLFKKEYADLSEAGRMELRLKKLKNRKIIERIIKDKEIKLGL
jgi:putative endonuclease